MNRRAFLGLSIAGAGSIIATPYISAAPSPLTSTHSPNKRHRMLRWLAGDTDPNYTPAAFFLHFGPDYKAGAAATRRHLEFFRHTNMDFIKIQFEQTYDRQPFLENPSDWSKITLRKTDFYEPLLQTVREIVAEMKKEALILMTLYSPFMCAGHCATTPVLRNHLNEDPDAVERGLEILTESQLIFVRACIKTGIDGFYMSTQGSEANQFTRPQIFNDYIKPADLVAMTEIQAACAFNILHVCDYAGPYDNYAAVSDYPGHVVNCSLNLANQQLSWDKITSMFKRPCMGGMDRRGILTTGTPEQIEAEVKQVIATAPKQFILGADCTVARTTDWDRLRHAISVAHRTGRA